MRDVQPEVYVIAETKLHDHELASYLHSIGAEDWRSLDPPSDGEELIEVAGRLCYRSWKPGLNANVKKVREGNDIYIENILNTRHGSVLEHSSVTFLFKDVSRVFTHELVRHRQGVAISQESLRYVALTDIPFWTPTCFTEDEDLERRDDFWRESHEILEVLESFQRRWRARYGLDESSDFPLKKKFTSGLRRYAPDGVATSIVWTANMRTLRFVTQLRTEMAAEEEIRAVYKKVGLIAKERWPNVFQDFELDQDNQWIPKNIKV